MIRALVERTGIDPHLIEDVRWGCVQQQGEQGFDIARIAALAADLPVETAGVTINRNCASSLQAINDAAMAIVADVRRRADRRRRRAHGPRADEQGLQPVSRAVPAAQRGDHEHGPDRRIPRGQVPDLAQEAGRIRAAEPPAGRGGDREGGVRRRDRPDLGPRRRGAEGPARPPTSASAATPRSSRSAALPPAFNPAGGSVTAGNSSPLNVAAVAVLVMSEDKARELGLKPMARIRSIGVAGVNPEEMGIGPVPAVHKALKRAGAVARRDRLHRAQRGVRRPGPLGAQALEFDEEKVNTRGGAIAIGHPLGASGARIATTLLHRMRDEGARYGLATMCVGQGQGVATIFEACDN